MGLSQREKGKRAEREAVALLKSLGFEAERSVQHCGRSTDSSDIRTSVPGIRFEVKGGYDDVDISSAEVAGWLSKLAEEAEGNQVGMVLWKRSRKPWLAVFFFRGIQIATPHIEGAIKLLSSSG